MPINNDGVHTPVAQWVNGENLSDIKLNNINNDFSDGITYAISESQRILSTVGIHGIRTITESTTLTASDIGKTVFVMVGSTEITITLPDITAIPSRDINIEESITIVRVPLSNSTQSVLVTAFQGQHINNMNATANLSAGYEVERFTKQPTPNTTNWIRFSGDTDVNNNEISDKTTIAEQYVELHDTNGNKSNAVVSDLIKFGADSRFINLGDIFRQTQSVTIRNRHVFDCGVRFRRIRSSGGFTEGDRVDHTNLAEGRIAILISYQGNDTVITMKKVGTEEFQTIDSSGNLTPMLSTGWVAEFWYLENLGE